MFDSFGVGESESRYIFRGDEEDLGPMSLQCGRKVDALKLYFEWNTKGLSGIAKRVEKTHQLALDISESIASHPELELYERPESFNICFRFNPRDKKVELNGLNEKIRDHLIKKKHLFNYGYIEDQLYIRLAPFNELITLPLLKELVEDFIEEGKLLL